MPRRRTVLVAVAVGALLVTGTALSGALSGITTRANCRNHGRLRKGADADKRHEDHPEQRPEPKLHPRHSHELRQEPPLPADIRPALA